MNHGENRLYSRAFDLNGSRLNVVNLTFLKPSS